MKFWMTVFKPIMMLFCWPYDSENVEIDFPRIDIPPTYVKVYYCRLLPWAHSFTVGTNIYTSGSPDKFIDSSVFIWELVRVAQWYKYGWKMPFVHTFKYKELKEQARSIAYKFKRVD